MKRSTRRESAKKNIASYRQARECKGCSSDYRAIFDSVNDAIFIHDPVSGSILDVNKKMTEMYGYTAEEAGRLTVGDLSSGIPPFTQEGAIERIGRALSGGEPPLFEWHAKGKKGNLFWVEVNLKQTVINNAFRIVAVVRDISERKKIEEALREMNEKLEIKVLERTESLRKTTGMLEEQKEILQTIIDTIPVMLAFYDSSGKTRLINKEFERVIGWSQEEIEDMDIMKAFYPDPSSRKQAWDSMMEAKPGWKDIELTNRSGKVLQAAWANVRLSDGSQIGIGIDISDRKRMEEDLTKLAAAVEQAGEGILLFSPEGVIEYVNPANEGLSGYRRDELVGKSSLVLGQETFDSYQATFDRIRTDGKAWTSRQGMKRKNGESYEVNLTVSPVRDAAGRIIYFVAVIQDITREVLLQQQISQTQKMEALGTLAGGVAHDLKNIFTPILINTEIALEDVGTGSPVHPVLEEVLGAAQIGRDLVKQIVTFSRKTPLSKRQVAISPIVRETLNFLRSSLPSTIEIRDRFDDGGAQVLADPTQIKQVLINLGSNAGHAMRAKGGILDVSLSKVVIDEGNTLNISPDLAPGPYVRITVADTGEGMDKKTMEHIFEPFFTTKKKGEGTGMGLAVVHGIVKEHQGAIAVKSTPGRGSTFMVYLPSLQANRAEKGCTGATAV